MSVKRIIDGHEVSFDSEWIEDLESEEHWIYYWNQVKTVFESVSKDGGLVEIGVGTKFLSSYLISKGYSVLTVDIDAKKSPDCVSSASDFNYTSAGCRAVAAFEIFEHIPYETFNKLLDKISESHVETIVFSVPVRNFPLIRASIKIPGIPKFKPSISIPRVRIRSQNHFWELTPLSSRSLPNGRMLINRQSFARGIRAKGFDLVLQRRAGSIEYYTASRRAS